MLHFYRRSAIFAFLLSTGSIAFCIYILLRATAEHNEGATYSQIEDGLYLGGAVDEPPPGTRAVLNLCEREDPYCCEIHRWDKIPDAAPAPTLAWLRKNVEFVDTQRRAGVPTYVHCYGGVSRAGMVTTAYYMFKNNWTRDEALAFVRSKRTVVNPNPAFMDLLEEWEIEVLGKAAKNLSGKSSPDGPR
jgi:hypothetical protein